MSDLLRRSLHGRVREGVRLRHGIDRLLPHGLRRLPLRAVGRSARRARERMQRRAPQCRRHMDGAQNRAEPLDFRRLLRHAHLGRRILEGQDLHGRLRHRRRSGEDDRAPFGRDAADREPLPRLRKPVRRDVPEISALLRLSSLRGRPVLLSARVFRRRQQRIQQDRLL